MRVAFHEALASPEQMGAPLEPSPFRFEPRIKGTALWAAPDRIEFRPAERLPDGEAYAASLDLTALFPKGKAPLPRFDFVFGTMRQSFDVAIEGLQAQDATDIKRQTLTGRLVTADVEDARGRREGAQGLARRARAGGGVGARPGPPHPRLHAWPASSAPRRPGRCACAGTAARSARPARRSVRSRVPGLSTFGVEQARVVVAPEPHVELRFTDPLQPGQNLKGLVRIADRDDLRFVVDGSRLEIYGTRGWRGEQTVRVEAGVRNVLGYRLKEARELAVAVRAAEARRALRGQGRDRADLGRLHRADRDGQPARGHGRGAADRGLERAAVPAGERPGRRAGAAARRAAWCGRRRCRSSSRPTRRTAG